MGAVAGEKEAIINNAEVRWHVLRLYIILSCAEHYWLGYDDNLIATARLDLETLERLTDIGTQILAMGEAHGNYNVSNAVY